MIKWLKNKIIWFFIGGVAFGAIVGLPTDCVTNNSKGIAERIETCPVPANKRATFKGQEIARVVSLGKTVRPNYDIEIVEIKAIEKGVELYARAWKNGKQIGFGKDGTVDMERFIIINPPVLVDDPQGSIIREWTDDITGELKQRKLRENPQEALLQTLEHNLSVMKNIHSDEKIVKEKRGNTTSTFYPDAHTETNTVDGFAGMQLADAIWATVRNGVGDIAIDTSGNISNPQRIGSTVTTDQWSHIYRGFFLFDTSSIGSSDTVSSATMSLYSTTGYKADALNITPNIVVVSGNPASNTEIVAGDYDSVGNTDYSNRIAYVDWSTSGAYNDFTINASGIAAIDKVGITKYATRNGQYDIDNVAPTWSSSKQSWLDCIAADTAGTSSDPKLVVEHSAGVSAEEVNSSQIMIIGI